MQNVFAHGPWGLHRMGFRRFRTLRLCLHQDLVAEVFTTSASLSMCKKLCAVLDVSIRASVLAAADEIFAGIRSNLITAA